ncbi:MAG: Na+/H+ antiporter NhaC family protein [Galactobacillus timonensis]|uniref:Na+/H+ antiporter NhaC family protein n=1 Tax=Galactobacillus timonensis TaxID=2041840 RepID=UPI002409436D|nr:Na+/H+ antiporter NhaC family protein [Galactobacillus timonensis]MDD5850719.1 Na+/H+ antiporter NhaC family protein [Galactobacillus timonensis]MDD6599293.1 Na+/H+ antiporter NhaC family protein [Galactobacillus timonensis]
MERVMDHHTWLHKLLTYGVGIVLVCVCFAVSAMSEEVNPAIGTLIVIFLLYYALLSRRILETLIFGAFMGLALIYGKGGFSGFVDGLVERTYSNMELDDFVWMIVNCDLLNVFVRLLGRAGSTASFSKIVQKHAKTGKSLNFWTWLMQFPLFFDDYMHITVNGGIMTPIYDEKKVPREDCAFIIQTLGEPIRVLFPISSWTAFMAGIFVVDGFASTYAEGFRAFLKTIPFSFYAWVAMIGSLLFALEKLPRFRGMKTPHPELYKPLDEIENDTETERSGRRGNLFDFFMPILVMILLSYFFDWDLVPAMLVVTPLTFVYYLLRGIIDTDDVEECLIEGCKEFTYLNLLILFSYVLGDCISAIGYTDYLVGLAQQFADPRLLPLALFVIFSCSEAAMSLNWNLLLIAFPVILPMAIQIGANPYLCAAAMISAGAFGNNFCYICDFSTLTASVTVLPTAYHASNCVPYSLMFGAVTAVLYLVAGFIF